jgi:hypothetical protein
MLMGRFGHDHFSDGDGASVSVTISCPKGAVGGVSFSHDGECVGSGPALYLLFPLFVREVIQGSQHISAKVLDELFRANVLFAEIKFLRHGGRVDYETGVLEGGGKDGYVMSVVDGSFDIVGDSVILGGFSFGFDPIGFRFGR